MTASLRMRTLFPGPSGQKGRMHSGSSQNCLIRLYCMACPAPREPEVSATWDCGLHRCETGWVASVECGWLMGCGCGSRWQNQFTHDARMHVSVHPVLDPQDPYSFPAANGRRHLYVTASRRQLRCASAVISLISLREGSTESRRTHLTAVAIFRDLGRSRATLPSSRLAIRCDMGT